MDRLSFQEDRSAGGGRREGDTYSGEDGDAAAALTQGEGREKREKREREERREKREERREREDERKTGTPREVTTEDEYEIQRRGSVTFEREREGSRKMF